ncbi:hypothetical protein OG552_29200 [Streptomyces sp. NBC_01476]|uniref:hypothetical protein n=1 Tax=Streptomyces sp. NBC_01476 TaxID=2903881 RepID=UPI002E3786F5|nr:hypothetical protein [Streptomyces sp. NBC_01476]
MRLRGEISQGVVCRPAALQSVDLARAAAGGEELRGRAIAKVVSDACLTRKGGTEYE